MILRWKCAFLDHIKNLHLKWRHQWVCGGFVFGRVYFWMQKLCGRSIFAFWEAKGWGHQKVCCVVCIREVHGSVNIGLSHGCFSKQKSVVVMCHCFLIQNYSIKVTFDVTMQRPFKKQGPCTTFFFNPKGNQLDCLWFLITVQASWVLWVGIKSRTVTSHLRKALWFRIQNQNWTSKLILV